MDKFNKNGFFKYLEDNFCGFDNLFLRGTVENLVSYGVKHFTGTKDQLVYFLGDILPELEFGEIAQFVNRDLLTTYGKEQVREFK